MELRDYLNVIRARKWIIIQAVIIVTLTAIVVSLLQPPTFQGEARVLVSEKDAGAAIFGTVLSEFSSQPERGLQTQVQLMQLRPLAERAIRQLNLQTSPEALLDRVTVSALGQTNVVTISATDGNAKRAADIANAMADAFVAWSRESKRESVKAAADEVQTRLDQAKTEILALGKKINEQANRDTKPGESNPISAEWTAELQIATGLYSTLADKLEQLRVNEQLETGSGQVVSGAVVDPMPVSPKPVRNGALGLAVGLVFGLGMAFLFEYLDNTIKSTDEAEKYYGAPVLGHIPAEKFEKDEARRLTIVQHPGSPAAEAYRVLRNSLEFINFEHDIKTLLVTSSAPWRGQVHCGVEPVGGPDTGWGQGRAGQLRLPPSHHGPVLRRQQHDRALRRAPGPQLAQVGAPAPGGREPSCADRGQDASQPQRAFGLDQDGGPDSEPEGMG